MKKFLINWILFFILPIAVLSCKKLLDKPFQNGSSNAEMWKDLPLIETFVDSIYHDALGFPFAIIRLSDFSDESLFPPTGALMILTLAIYLQIIFRVGARQHHLPRQIISSGIRCIQM